MITHEQRRLNREAAIQAIRDGVDIQDVEKTYNLSFKYIRDICNDAGIHLYRYSYKVSRNRSIEILSHLMDKDKTLYQIAKELGITPQRVDQINAIAKEVNFPGLPNRSKNWKRNKGKL